jgi:hypothetical protein
MMGGIRSWTGRTRSGLLGAALVACAAGGGAEALAAQSWEDFSASRRAAGIRALDVEVTYGAGRLAIRPGDSGTLYRFDLHYDAEHFEPVVEFSGDRLELGTETRGRDINIDSPGDEGALDLELSPDVAMDLSLQFGAVKADLELGGMTFSGLDLATGASQSTVSFSRPTRGRIRTAQFEVGAADFDAEGLGNLRADRIDLEAGVGDLMLDFSGEWVDDMEVDVEIGLGALEIRIPEGVGVRLEKDSFLTRIDADWLNRDGDIYLSDDWESAEHRITIDVEAAFGRIEVVRIRG